MAEPAARPAPPRSRFAAWCEHHLHSLGARAIPRSDFAGYLRDHLDQASSGPWVS